MLNEKLFDSIKKTRHEMIDFHLFLERITDDMDMKIIIKKEISHLVSATNEEFLIHVCRLIQRKICDDRSEFNAINRRF